MGHVGHEGTLHHARLLGALCFLLQLFLLSHERCQVTDHTVALHDPAVLIETWQAVEHVPLQLVAVVEDGSCMAEVGHGLGEMCLRLEKALHDDVIVDEHTSQLLEAHDLLRDGEALVEGNLFLDEVCPPEPHVAFVHQVLQLVLILLYLLVLLADEHLVCAVFDKEVALLCQVADREGEIQQLPLLVQDGVQAHLRMEVHTAFQDHALGTEE